MVYPFWFPLFPVSRPRLQRGCIYLSICNAIRQFNPKSSIKNPPQKICRSLEFTLSLSICQCRLNARQCRLNVRQYRLNVRQYRLNARQCRLNARQCQLHARRDAIYRVSCIASPVSRPFHPTSESNIIHRSQIRF